MFSSLDDQGVDHAFMLRWHEGSWGQYMVPSVTVSHCVIEEGQRKVLTLVPDGRVHIATPSGFDWENVDPSNGGPNALRHMVDIRPIDGIVYAVGMARMVYRRAQGGLWQRFDSGIGKNRAPFEVSGFRSIDGCAFDAIYAVGLKGDMWHFDGSIWSQINSPTNVNLEKVRCVSRNEVYACGARGTMLRGSEHRWEVVEHDATEKTLWSAEYLDGHLYLADSKRIYRYGGERLEPVDTGLPVAPTVSYLHANDGLLASVGEKDIVVYDGVQWRRLEIIPG